MVWNHLESPSQVIETLRNNPNFNLKNVIKWDKQFLSSLCLMLYVAIPTLTPPIFQRVIISKNTSQVKKSFTYAAFIDFFVCTLIAFLGVLLLTDNPHLDPTKLVNYIVHEYTYTGFKGLVAIGIIAMSMSTADSELNACAVTFVNDFVKPLFPTWEITVSKIRVFTLLIGTFALFLALYTKDLLATILLSASLYMPIVGIPFMMAIFGFRTTPKVVLIGMTAGFVTVLIFKLGHLDLDSVVPGMLANALFLFTSHYLLKQPGGWVGIKDKAPLLAARQKRREFWTNLIQNFKDLNLHAHLKKNLPTHDAIYFFLGLYVLGVTYTFFFTTPEAAVLQYQKLYDISAYSVLICAAGLLIYPALPSNLRAKRFVTYAWPLVIGYTLFVVGTQLVLMNGFNIAQLMILLCNLMLVATFLSPLLTLFIPIVGALVGYLAFVFCYGPLDGVFSSLKFNLIYILLFISTFFLSIFRVKRQKDKIEAEKEHLGVAYAGKRKELTQVIQYSQQLAQEIEETPELFNENALAYIRQLIYHIKDYVQLEVSSITFKKLIHDVRAMVNAQPFKEAPTLLVQTKTNQADISADADKIKQLVLNSIVLIHKNNKANKPIQIILEDTTLGYTVSYIKDYLKKIKALRITITTADNLPLVNDIYTFNPISFDGKAMDETLVENLRIIDAHYGYAAVNQLDTHLYVIPIQVRDVRAKVMELLREPTKVDPEELKHPYAIKVEKELWQQLSNTKIDKQIIEKALDTIKRFHAKVKRKSGEPFFTHPINVALILLTYCQDQDAVAAALLHDTVEDTQLSIANIKALFGEQVAFIVGKVTNLEDQLRRIALGDHENIERLIKEENKRALYVKLADRMHNMRTIEGHPSLKRQKTIANETLSFFVPAAFNLGLTKIGEELQKLSLDVLSKADTGQ